MDFSFSSDQQLLKTLGPRVPRRALQAGRRAAPVGRPARRERRPCGRRWPSSAGSASRCPRPTAAAGSAWSRSAILLEELGRVAYPGPVLADRTGGRRDRGGGHRRAEEALALRRSRPATRARRVALLDADLDWDPDADRRRGPRRRSKGWALSGTKRFVPWAHVADVLLVPARAPEGSTLFLVDPASTGLKLSPVPGMDLATRWLHLDLDKVPAAPDAVLGAPGAGGARCSTSLLRRGAVGAAAEMLGAARRCLDMAVELRQGPRAVRAADRLVPGDPPQVRRDAPRGGELARGRSTTRPGRSTRRPTTRRWRPRSRRRTSATPRARCAARRSRCTAGIGFTWEYDLHLYFKRAKALEAMYGDADYHREQIVRYVAR